MVPFVEGQNATGVSRATAVPPSSFTKGQFHPCISHAVNEDETRTLCGRDCADWVFNRPHSWDDRAFEPDCLVCRRVLKLR